MKNMIPELYATKVYYHLHEMRTSVEFHGSQFSTDGHKPMDKRKQDIQLMPKPKDLKQF